MVNSIKDKLDEADTVSEIKLTLTHNPNNVCVVVEGTDDQNLFRPLLLDNVEIFHSYASNVGVDNIVQNYFLGNKRVIGIRDKYYLTSPINDQCFFCDYCCAEMMIISVDGCFDRLYCNFYKAVKMNSPDISVQIKYVHLLQETGNVVRFFKFSQTKPFLQCQETILLIFQLSGITSCHRSNFFQFFFTLAVSYNITTHIFCKYCRIRRYPFSSTYFGYIGSIIV